MSRRSETHVESADRVAEAITAGQTSSKPTHVPTTTQADSGERLALTGAGFNKLAENEFNRYFPNSSKIGHAVITTINGQPTAAQFAIEQERDPDAPSVRPLHNIRSLQPFRGMFRYEAQTPGGTMMYAKRFVKGKVTHHGREEEFDIACFSPSFHGGKPFWGSMKPTPVFKAGLSDEQKAEIAEIKPVAKEGVWIDVEPDSIKARDLITNRKPDQNTVMGESARDAYQYFFEQFTDSLHPDMKKRLQRSFNAFTAGQLSKQGFSAAQRKKEWVLGFYRPEWLHGDGFTLMPMSMDPQVKSNLGAAPKWTNTLMMVLERTAKWVALNCPDARVAIKHKFDMLLDSELIKTIDFRIRLQFKEHMIEYFQTIDPFLSYPTFPKASDTAQTIAITDKIAKGEKPAFSDPILGAADQMSTTLPSSNASEAESAFKSYRSATTQPLETPMPTTSAQGAGAGATAATAPAVVSSDKKNHNNQVVQIFAESFEADYDHPWRDPQRMASSGSGFIYRHNDFNYIVTNAHVAENALFLQVRLANQTKTYVAEIEHVAYQCDVAVLKVDDPEFQAMVEPVEFADWAKIEDRVTIVGFPMGGEEVSTSKGIISRIQTDSYSISNQRIVQYQTDGALNPGNSGGPVFDEAGNVMGIAFQGYNGYQGLNYIIPGPIAKKTVHEILSGNEFRGLPSIPFHFEVLTNQYERQYCGLGKHRSGVRINSIDTLSDAHKKLKPGDILVKIDGHEVSNRGTVNLEDTVGKVIDMSHLSHMKNIGDTSTLTVLRKNEDTGAVEELDVDVLIDTVEGETERVGVEEHDKMPTFYIGCGISFVPLSRNYMESGGSIFEEMHILGEEGSLADLAKERPDDQVIVIQDFLACKATEGYDKYRNELAVEINGHKIRNMRDVIAAMENHQGKYQIIKTSGKGLIVVPNMSHKQHQALLKMNRVSRDRSDDLSTAAIELSAAEQAAYDADSPFVVEGQLTQEGIHALFRHLGYGNISSGMIHGGGAVHINHADLNRQGFMPVFIQGGASKSGHWTLLFKNAANQYYLYDPMGRDYAARTLATIQASLPAGRTVEALSIAPGLNHGLCGYWAASAGLRAKQAIDSGRSLADVSTAITEQMRLEQGGYGLLNIRNWLNSISATMPGDASESLIDAQQLRLRTQPRAATELEAMPASTTSRSAASASASPAIASESAAGKVSHKTSRQAQHAKTAAPAKRRRVVADSDSDSDDELDMIKPTTDQTKEAAEADEFAKGMTPGQRKFMATIDRMERHYEQNEDAYRFLDSRRKSRSAVVKDLATLTDDDDEDDEDYMECAQPRSPYDDVFSEDDSSDDEDTVVTAKRRRIDSPRDHHGLFKATKQVDERQEELRRSKRLSARR